jgi:hypothetical protein
MALAAGWINFGSGYQNCQYRLVGDVVQLRGMTMYQGGGSYTITTLPAGYRPPMTDHDDDWQRSVVALTSPAAVRCCGSARGGDLGPLNGISFSVRHDRWRTRSPGTSCSKNASGGAAPPSRDPAVLMEAFDYWCATYVSSSIPSTGG